MKTLERAEKELAEGNLWRAKEILQGAIPNAGYNAELFEKLGTVLLKMGDLPEAGKFLFLSGVRKPEYEDAIKIFFYKYRRNKPLNFFRAFPNKAQLTRLSDYPDNVAEKLRELGFPETLKDEQGKNAILSETDNGAIYAIGCLVIGLVIVALVILGLIKLKEILF